MNTMALLLERLRPAIERLGGCRIAGEDLYGDVCLACVRQANRYDWSHPQIEGRVLRIARNLWITRLRRESLRRCSQLPHDSNCQALSYSACLVDESKSQVQSRCAEAVSRLSPRCRRIIREHIFKGESLVRIAEKMRIPAPTVRTLWRRARQQLARDSAFRELTPNE